MMRFPTLLLTLFAVGQAFTVVGPMARSLPLLTTKLSLMTPSETEAVMKQAAGCSEGECSLDEVQDLIDVLKSQQKELYERVQTVKNQINTLEVLNSKGDARKVDEVRETIRALFRVFQLGDKASGNDYPSLSRATGWSGDVGDGPKTAYDSLPPKKWKKP